ncbi:hypothetical protein BH20VER3_BH20VER3_08880 [soil metagenome]
MRPGAERWARVKELFEAAVDLAPDERATLLEKECASDESLRHEIESLLASDEQAEGFIEQPAVELPHDLFPAGDEEPLAGRQFGAYQIIREIGRGGLGAVYLARRSDDEYRKEVAVKVIRRGLDTDDILRRFRNERQILAQLDHPNIARLTDGGTTDDGLPYFVMEHVKGEPIAAYCDANALTLTDRLKLFRKVCAAVTYAHQNLVIHRDLKPSNILVTPEGEPKLLDFGIAKLLSTDDEMLTQTTPGLRAMTPDYASPEQIKGEKITTASDIYSLGVLLYELLTTRKPYRLKTRTTEEISRAITEQEPERPSTASRRGDSSPQSEIQNPKSLRGDLDNIVLKAMRKEPARRYASVAQFSDDIRRHLEGLPVIARQDTLRYRSEKFIRRHKVGVAAAALIALSLIGGIIATFWQAHRATQQRDRAERRFADVRKLSNALLFDIAPKIERLEGSTEARESLVRRALEYLDSLAEESASDLELRSELAAAYERVGDLQGAPRKPNLSDFAGAIASYEKARTIRQNLLAKNPHDGEMRSKLASNFAESSIIRWWTNDYEGALKNSSAALNLYEQLVTEQPDSIELRTALAEVRIDRGQTHAGNNQFAEAYPHLQKALATLDELNRKRPHDQEISRLLGKCHVSLGFAFSWNGKQPEAEAEMARALAICEPLVATNPNDALLRQGLWSTYLQTSAVYEEVDDKLSEHYARKALQIAEETVERDRANTQARQNLAKSYSRLGIVSSNLKNFSEAAFNLEKSSTVLAELQQNEPNNPAYKSDLGKTFARFGDAKYQEQDLEGSLAAFEKAAAIFESLSQADGKHIIALRDLALVCKNIGHIHRDFALAATAEKRRTHLRTAHDNYRRALDILSELKSNNAFAEFDQPFYEEMLAAVAIPVE